MTPGAEPMLMRCRRVKEILGLSKHELAKLIDAELLRPVQLRPKGKRFYRTAEVMKLMDGVGHDANKGGRNEDRKRGKVR